jgi:hypothetical protein
MVVGRRGAWLRGIAREAGAALRYSDLPAKLPGKQGERGLARISPNPKGHFFSKGENE